MSAVDSSPELVEAVALAIMTHKYASAQTDPVKLYGAMTETEKEKFRRTARAAIIALREWEIRSGVNTKSEGV